MKRTLIRCGWIVSLDDNIGDLVDADILVGDDRILAIGKDLGTAETIIDARDMIAIPGLIDAHLHIWLSGLKAAFCDQTTGDTQKFLKGLAELDGLFTPEDNYIATLSGAMSRLDGGVTTLLDYCHNVNSVEQAQRSVDALEDSGIRAVFALGEGSGWRGQGEAGIAGRRARRRDILSQVRARLHSQDKRVTMTFAMAGPHWAEEEQTVADIALAREFGLKTTSHATKPPEDALMADGYRRLIERGLLGEGDNIVHGNSLPDDELKQIVDAGISATSTVVGEMRGAIYRGRPPLVGRLRELGALPSLGVDSEDAHAGDLFLEMRTALMSAVNERNRREQETGKPLSTPPVSTREALLWATLGGARALGIEHSVGSLTPGKKADIVLLASKDSNLFPVHNPLFSAGQMAHAGNVDTVLVDGKVVKRNRQLTRAPSDVEKIQTQLAQSADRMMRTLNAH